MRFTLVVASLVLAASATARDAMNVDWQCDNCTCQSDNPRLWSCCNDANMTDCYAHLKWGDEKDCKQFCHASTSVSVVPGWSVAGACSISSECHLPCPFPEKNICKAGACRCEKTAPVTATSAKQTSLSDNGDVLSTVDWECDNCKCQSDNPMLWSCCNDANMTDCYAHLKWGDEKDCKQFCHASGSRSFKLAEYYNMSRPGPGCNREPVCQYKGTSGSCTPSIDGLCTDIIASENSTGVYYQHFPATRDGSCKGPAIPVFVKRDAADACSPSNQQGWFVISEFSVN